MKLYLLSQNIVTGYDTYDCCVVSAESRDDAITIHPSGYKNGAWPKYECGSGWVNFSDIESISVEYLGETEKPRGVICASFNAG